MSEHSKSLQAQNIWVQPFMCNFIPGRSMSEKDSMKSKSKSNALSGVPFLWFVSLGMQRNEQKKQHTKCRYSSITILDMRI